MIDIQQAKEQAEQIKNLLHEQIKAFSIKYPELHLSVSSDSVTTVINSMAGPLTAYDIHSSYSISVK